MGFHYAIYPLAVQYRSSIGAGFGSAVTQTDSGGISVNQNWADPLRVFDLSQQVMTPAEFDTFRTFYFARAGAANTWLLRDPTDYTTSLNLDETDEEKRRPRRVPPTPTDVVLGTYDGSNAVFQLKNFYADQGIFRERLITKPKEGSVVAAINGQVIPSTVFSVDLVLGTITIAWSLINDALVAQGQQPVQPGTIVTAGCEFYVPVRFSESSDEAVTNSVDAPNREGVSIQAIEEREDIFLPSEPLKGGTFTWGAETLADPILQPALGLTQILDALLPQGLNPRLPQTQDWPTGRYFNVWNASPFSRQLIAPDTTSVTIPALGKAEVALYDTITGGQRWLSVVSG